MEKINVAELLKDCPSGMELDCTMYENTSFKGLAEDTLIKYPILVNICTDDGEHQLRLTKEGCWSPYPHAKCVIFPKGKTTWEGFVPPCKFKDGDILAYTSSYTTVFIYRNKDNEPKHATSFYVGYTIGGRCYCNFHIYNKSTIIALNGDCDTRFATEEEKQKLFQAIKDNGYKWNDETKTLEKLIEPKFKVGDRITLKNYNDGNVYKIIDIKDTYYVTDQGKLSFYYADSWKLVTNKFDINTLVPFESRVLVRNDESQYWIPAFWGCKRADGYTTTFGWCKYCIPFERNEYLLETNNDCDEYFKTWG